MDGELLEVGAVAVGIDAFDAGEALRRVPGYQDDEGLGQLGHAAGPGEGPDPERVEQRVGRHLEGWEERQLVGTGGPDVDHPATVA